MADLHHTNIDLKRSAQTTLTARSTFQISSSPTMVKPPAQQQFEREVIHDVDSLMESLTKAIAHLSFPPKPRLHLFTLPQEIQDFIFDLAYPPIDGFKPISRLNWNWREKRKRRSDGRTYTMQPFPPPKVSQFMVSKRFFLAAAKAFVGNQTFTDDDVPRSLGVLTSRRGNVVTCFVTKAKLELSDLRYTLGAGSFAPNLKSLTLTVEDGDFDTEDLSTLENDSFANTTSKYPWEEELNDKDIEAVASYHNIEHFAGVKKFQLIPKEECRNAETNAQKLLYNTNLCKLEEYIKSIVLRPRQSIETPSLQNDTALYPGSKVSLESSEFMQANRQGHDAVSEAAFWDTYVHQLPSTVEGMTALLKKDGERLMEFIAHLKFKEMTGRF